jgi:hypothetical protein
MSDANQTFTAIAAIQGLGLGAILGATGQGIRVIVGLKKAAESAQAAGSNLKQVFNGARLLVSLLIGAIAGVLAALPFISQAETITYQTLVALLGAGYAGLTSSKGSCVERYPTPATVHSRHRHRSIKPAIDGHQRMEDSLRKIGTINGNDIIEQDDGSVTFSAGATLDGDGANGQFGGPPCYAPSTYSDRHWMC